ncbi:putative cytochrome P450 reductase domain protein [Mycobacterium kansasii]|uniref:Putative cytochrome P450 reductase domain protein n=1 Tax=Mycobacterium kansasii TaxID=1768 RepID=A0A1V3XDF5_MYCKA|nr:putative cytochrome P450 reductase domain protein [Mycobacterium kansasii]
MDAATAWAEAMKFENRPNPYPYFKELRRTPVAKVADKTYVVTGYLELLALAHDPRISSDISRSPQAWAAKSPLPGANTCGPTAAAPASSSPTRPSTTGPAGR